MSIPRCLCDADTLLKINKFRTALRARVPLSDENTALGQLCNSVVNHTFCRGFTPAELRRDNCAALRAAALLIETCDFCTALPHFAVGLDFADLLVDAEFAEPDSMAFAAALAEVGFIDGARIPSALETLAVAPDLAVAIIGMLNDAPTTAFAKSHPELLAYYIQQGGLACEVFARCCRAPRKSLMRYDKNYGTVFLSGLPTSRAAMLAVRQVSDTDILLAGMVRSRLERLLHADTPDDIKQMIELELEYLIDNGGSPDDALSVFASPVCESCEQDCEQNCKQNCKQNGEQNDQKEQEEQDEQKEQDCDQDRDQGGDQDCEQDGEQDCDQDGEQDGEQDRTRDRIINAQIESGEPLLLKKAATGDPIALRVLRMLVNRKMRIPMRIVVAGEVVPIAIGVAMWMCESACPLTHESVAAFNFSEHQTHELINELSRISPALVPALPPALPPAHQPAPVRASEMQTDVCETRWARLLSLAESETYAAAVREFIELGPTPDERRAQNCKVLRKVARRASEELWPMFFEDMTFADLCESGQAGAPSVLRIITSRDNSVCEQQLILLLAMISDGPGPELASHPETLMMLLMKCGPICEYMLSRCFAAPREQLLATFIRPDTAVALCLAVAPFIMRNIYISEIVFGIISYSDISARSPLQILFRRMAYDPAHALHLIKYLAALGPISGPVALEVGDRLEALIGGKLFDNRPHVASVLETCAAWGAKYRARDPSFPVHVARLLAPIHKPCTPEVLRRVLAIVSTFTSGEARDCLDEFTATAAKTNLAVNLRIALRNIIDAQAISAPAGK